MNSMMDSSSQWQVPIEGACVAAELRSTPANWMDWYQQVISKVRGRRRAKAVGGHRPVLITVAGQGEFLHREGDYPERREAILDGLKEMLVPGVPGIEPIPMVVAFDGMEGSAERVIDTVREFESGLRQNARPGADPPFVALRLRGGKLGNHFSMFEDELFVEFDHKPDAATDERSGYIISGSPLWVDSHKKAWNAMMNAESVVRI